MRNNSHNNAAKFEELTEHLKFIDMEEHCEIIWRILAAILMLGEIRFVEGNNGEAELDSNEAANRGKLNFNSRIQYVEFKCKYVKMFVYEIPSLSILNYSGRTSWSRFEKVYLGSY